MRKLIKYGVLGIVIIALGWNLSQCTGGNPGNMRQYEIINQIKSKMKTEMDRIDFEVNFDDYEFKVKPLQSFGDYGSVTIKDKRYNYDPIKIYDGSLQKLEEEKIGVNPIIFVAHGYQDYVDNVLLNDKSRGNNLDEALRVSGGRLTKITSWVSLSQTIKGILGDRISLDTVTEKTGKTGDYYNLPSPISVETYEAFFKHKKNADINYSEFVETMGYVISVVILTKNEITDEMKKEVGKYQNTKYLVFVLRNED